MTHYDQEEILRRALHAVADTIEPAPDGLERIRERLSRPHPLPVAWVMAAWTGLVQALQLRLEPAAEGEPGRLGSWLRLATRSLRAADERLRPAIDALLEAARALRPGSGMSRHEKLRSAMAFGAAALIGIAGGFALSAGLPQQVISAAQSAFSPGQPHNSGADGHNPGAGTGSGQPSPTQPGAATDTRKPTTSPNSSCKPTPTRSVSPSPTGASPTASGSHSPTPNPSTSTVSPTPSPSNSTGTPTPTQSASSAAAGPAAAPNKGSNSALTGSPHPTPTTAESSSGASNQTAHAVGSNSASPSAKATKSPC